MSNEQHSQLKIPSLEQIEKQKLEKTKLPVFERNASSSTESTPSRTAPIGSIPSMSAQSESNASLNEINNPTLGKRKLLASHSTSIGSTAESLPSTLAINQSTSTSSTPLSIATPPSRTRTPSIRKPTFSLNSILVNPAQHQNPVLKHIHNVAWEPSEGIKVDYVVGRTTGVIYLSLRYHRLYPSYIYDRLQSVQQLYVTRVLLVYVDIDSFHDALREINRVAVMSDFALLVAWSLEEAGRYLETLKAFENKPPDLIRERVEDDYLSNMTVALTEIPTVNGTDVLTLMSTFGSLKSISEAQMAQLAICPGFGEDKVKRVKEVWKQPFLANKKK